MAKEIEHKYLVVNDSYIALASNHFEIRQGYISRDPERIVRVRTKGNKGYLTVKGLTVNDCRAEFEYMIPYEDALEMLELCEGTIISKTRYIVEYAGYLWEVDRFHGNHEGMTVAEIELTSSHKEYPLPPFVGREVTGDSKYYNSNI